MAWQSIAGCPAETFTHSFTARSNLKSPIHLSGNFWEAGGDQTTQRKEQATGEFLNAMILYLTTGIGPIIMGFTLQE